MRCTSHYQTIATMLVDYGVCSIIRSDLFTKYKAKSRKVSWDKEGRVPVVELHGFCKKLALFNIYAVNETDNRFGTRNKARSET